MSKELDVEKFYVACAVIAMFAGPFMDSYSWLKSVCTGSRKSDRSLVSKETARKVVVGLGVAFAMFLIVMWRPEPHVGAKEGSTSPGSWREVPISNYGPFLTPRRGPAGVNGWLLSETLEEFLAINRELYYLSQGELKTELMNCRSPRIQRQWEKIGTRKYLVGCEPKDEADPKAYLLTFRSQEEGWALESWEKQKLLSFRIIRVLPPARKA